MHVAILFPTVKIMSLLIDKTVYTGRPQDKRSDVEEKTYDALDELGIAYSRVDHKPAETIPACHEIEDVLGIAICKNLLLTNSTESEFYLLMLPGEKKYPASKLSREIRSSRLSFAKPVYMERFLAIRPGSLSVMGLLNDTENRVRLLIDREVLASDFIGCHPCVNTSTLKIRTDDILRRFLPFTAHHYTPVNL